MSTRSRFVCFDVAIRLVLCHPRDADATRRALDDATRNAEVRESPYVVEGRAIVVNRKALELDMPTFDWTPRP